MRPIGLIGHRTPEAGRRSYRTGKVYRTRRYRTGKTYRTGKAYRIKKK